MWNWFNDNSGGIMGLATVALVVVTGFHVVFAGRAAASARESAKAVREAAEAAFHRSADRAHAHYARLSA